MLAERQRFTSTHTYTTILRTLNPAQSKSSVDFVRDNPGEPVPEETFTHSHPPWSSNIPICFLHLLRSMASSLFNPRALQSFFPQFHFKFSMVYLLAWHPPLHTPYISSPNHYLFFAAHAHTIATCFAVAPRLCHLILVSLSALYLGFVLHIQFILAWDMHQICWLAYPVALLHLIWILLMCNQ